MKNSNDTIGNRTRDLQTCSAVPQPTALLRAPTYHNIICHKSEQNIIMCGFQKVAPYLLLLTINLCADYLQIEKKIKNKKLPKKSAFIMNGPNDAQEGPRDLE